MCSTECLRLTPRSSSATAIGTTATAAAEDSEGERAEAPDTMELLGHVLMFCAVIAIDDDDTVSVIAIDDDTMSVIAIALFGATTEDRRKCVFAGTFC